MSKTLIVIDSYISDIERAFTCERLIKQVKSIFSDEYKTLLINKSGKDFGLQDKFDYYINLSNSFMVGLPPDNILENSLYERPYVYVNTSFGTCENWLPLTGITDHVAGIYNSFIISSKFAKNLNIDNIFKIEYDTNFDINELQDIKNDIDNQPEILFYGKRKNGDYAKEHHYLIDVHIIGYNVKLFDDFDIVKNDDEFWQLCKKINYYGKWIEYIIPSIYEYQINNKNILDGIVYDGNLRQKYPKTEFDIINGEGGWTEKWKSQPKICEIKNEDNENSEFAIFYWNDRDDVLDIESCITNDNGEIKYKKKISLNPKHYFFDTLSLGDEKLTINKKNTYKEITEEFTEIINKDILKEFNTKFKFNS